MSGNPFSTVRSVRDSATWLADRLNAFGLFNLSAGQPHGLSAAVDATSLQDKESGEVNTHACFQVLSVAARLAVTLDHSPVTDVTNCISRGYRVSCHTGRASAFYSAPMLQASIVRSDQADFVTTQASLLTENGQPLISAQFDFQRVNPRGLAGTARTGVTNGHLLDAAGLADDTFCFDTRRLVDLRMNNSIARARLLPGIGRDFRDNTSDLSSRHYSLVYVGSMVAELAARLSAGRHGLRYFERELFHQVANSLVMTSVNSPLTLECILLNSSGNKDTILGQALVEDKPVMQFEQLLATHKVTSAGIKKARRLAGQSGQAGE